MNIKHTILRAILAGIMWAIAYRFVRRGLNPEIEDPDKYNTDAMYGGLAVISVNLLLPLVVKYVSKVLL